MTNLQKKTVPAIFGQGTKNCLKSQKDAFNPLSFPLTVEISFSLLVAGSQHYFVIAFLVYVRLPLIVRKPKKMIILTRHFGKLSPPAEGRQVDIIVDIPTNTSTSFSMFPELPFSGRSEKCAGSFATNVSWPQPFFYGTPAHVMC